MVTRIRQLLEHKQLTPTQFADLIGVGRPVMSHILSERNKPSLEVVQRMINAFPDVSLPWLLSGTGEMLAAGATAIAAPPLNEPPVAPAPVSELPAPPGLADVEASVENPAAPPSLPLEGLPRPFTPVQPVSVPVAAAPVTPPTLAPQLAASPGLSAAEVTPSAAPVAPKPFRAARFVPPMSLAPAPTFEAAVAPTAPAASPTPAAVQPAFLPATPLAPAPPAALPASTEAAMLPFLAEPGKAIRRIVIFYRDGSFADYQPE